MENRTDIRKWVITADVYGTIGDSLYIQVSGSEPDTEIVVAALRKAGHGNINTRVWSKRQRKAQKNGRWRWYAGFVEVRI